MVGTGELDLSVGVSEKWKEAEGDVTQCWETLETFLKFHEENPLKVDIKVEQVKKRLLRGKKYFYKVEFSGAKQCTCTRKYEEFVTLSKVLRKRLEGTSIPPFRKKGIGDEETSVDKRIEGLKTFLAAVVRHPFLRFDSAFEDFMQSTEKFTIKRADALPIENSQGYQNWRRMIQVTKTPAKSLQILKALNAEIILLISFYRSLKLTIKTYISKLDNYSAALNELGTGFDTWKKIEGSQIPLLSGVATRIEDGDQENLPLSNMVVHIESKYRNSVQQINNETKELSKIIKGPVKFEILALESLREELKMVKKAVMIHKKTFERYEDANKAHFIATQPTFSGKELDSNTKGSVKAEANLAETKKANEKAEKYADLYSRGFLVIELQRFRHERAARGAAILKKLSGMNKSLADSASEAWTAAFNEIPGEVTARSDLAILSSVKENYLEAKAVDSLRSVPIIDYDKADIEFGEEGDDVEKIENVEMSPTRPIITRGSSCVRAISNFVSEQDGELDMVQGEILEGEFSEESPGYVPSSHVEVIEDDGASTSDASQNSPSPPAVPMATKPSVSSSPVQETNPAQEDPADSRPRRNSSRPPAPRPSDFLSSIESFKKTNLQTVA